MPVKPNDEDAMTADEIVEVFQTLSLPLAPSAQAGPQQSTSIVLFPITGNSPPLPAPPVLPPR
jgi:hypothetical protein